ncbi:MAG: type II secretion system GspH family protein [Phycisphaerae bacterium]|nr:type II secretion system GspH family protein [Phycisphaerae bacterium]MDW8261316.1 type II secretion system protein [Phycisphaerales bacterium]
MIACEGRLEAAGRGFTMVELLVVIAIIALLAGVLLVGVSRLYRQGGRLKSAADLQAIATALEAYKADFADYPRVPDPNTGAAVLARALVGPSPKPRPVGPWKRGEIYRQLPSPTPTQAFLALVDASTPPTLTPAPGLDSSWAPYEPRDGADGSFDSTAREFDGEPGFRNGPKTIDDDEDGQPDRPGGRIFGPYLPADKFKIAAGNAFLVDGNGNPILYFPAAASRPTISVVPRFVSGGDPTNNPGQQDRSALFDANDNLRFFMHNTAGGSLEALPQARALARIRAMLGDFGVNGALDRQPGMESETSPAADLPYLLWTAGPDGLFGPPVDSIPGAKAPLVVNPTDAGGWKSNQRAVEECDDITNFR